MAVDSDQELGFVNKADPSVGSGPDNSLIVIVPVEMADYSRVSSDLPIPGTMNSVTAEAELEDVPV